MFLMYRKITHTFNSAFLLGDEKISPVFQFSENVEKKCNSSAYFMDRKDAKAGKSKALGNTAQTLRSRWTL